MFSGHIYITKCIIMVAPSVAKYVPSNKTRCDGFWVSFLTLVVLSFALYSLRPSTVTWGSSDSPSLFSVAKYVPSDEFNQEEVPTWMNYQIQFCLCGNLRLQSYRSACELRWLHPLVASPYSDPYPSLLSDINLSLNPKT